MKPRTAKELLKQIADARRTPPPKMLTIHDLARLAKQRRTR